MSDPLATLNEIRIPELDGQAALASGLASLALGLALALLMGVLIRFVTRRRPNRSAVVRADLDAARNLPTPERFSALMRILAGLAGSGADAWPRRLAARFGPSRVPVAELEALRARLYSNGPPPDLTFLEALAERLIRRIRD